MLATGVGRRGAVGQDFILRPIFNRHAFARAFYRHHDFVPLQDHPNKLFLAMATIVAGFKRRPDTCARGAPVLLLHLL
ncbi:MAG: hypothetical protein ABSH47_07880 [Bryobacteraceae bacterium]